MRIRRSLALFLEGLSIRSYRRPALTALAAGLVLALSIVVGWPLDWGEALGSATARTYVGTVKLPRLDVAAGETVEFDPNVSTTVEVTGNVVVRGRLVMRPARPGVIHTLRFVGVDEMRFVGGHTDVPLDTDVGLWIIETGVWDAQGTAKTAWLRAQGRLNEGDTIIELQDAPQGWQSGDELVVAPTLPPTVQSFYDAYDYPRVVSVSGDAVRLDRPLRFDHPAVAVAPKRIMTAEVMNLTRNVRVEGQPGKRAHIHFNMALSAQAIRYAAIRYMGVPGKKGRYPLHFHMMGDGSNGSSVEGVVIRDGGNHAFVPHNSNGITFRDTIGHDIQNDVYWWDKLTGAGRDRNAPVTFAHRTLYERAVASRYFPVSRTDYTLTGFLLLNGIGTAVRDSVAVGGQGTVNGSGFHWPGGIDERAIPAIWEFERGNVTHNQRSHGLFIWQNTNFIHPIKNLVTYHNGGAGMLHGAYLNPYRYEGNLWYGNKGPGLDLHALSTAGPRGTLPGIVIIGDTYDAAGMSAYAIQANLHVSRGGPVRFERCTVKGATKAGVGVDVARVKEPTRLDFVNCTFEGNAFWFDDNAHPDSFVRVSDAKHGTIMLRPKSVSGGTFRPEWNANVFPTTPF